jgi:hypothetical protein
MGHLQIKLGIDVRMRADQHNLAYFIRSFLFVNFIDADHHVLEDSCC